MEFNRTAVEKLAEQLYARTENLKAHLQTDDPRSLSCKRRGSHGSFYLRAPGPDGRTECYIPQNELKSYRKLARKSYARSILPVLEQDLAALNRLLSDFSWKNELLLADRLPQDLIKLCGAGFESGQTFIKKWRDQTWTERPLYGEPPSHPTRANLLVRSKSEEFIANALFDKGLVFAYEKPVYLPGEPNPWFADFTILHPATLDKVFWEHFGMMDDPVYADRCCRKLMGLMRHGIYPGPQFICTFETRQHPLSALDVDKIIEHFFGR